MVVYIDTHKTDLVELFNLRRRVNRIDVYFLTLN